SVVPNGTVPRPVNFVRRHALKIAGFAVERLVFDEEPDLAFEYVIELLGGMGMGCRVIARCAHRVHQAAFAAVGALYDPRAYALLAAADYLPIGNIFRLAMKRHYRFSFTLRRVFCWLVARFGRYLGD